MVHRRIASVLVLVLGACAAVLAVPAGASAVSRSANRSLERIFERNPYPASDVATITRAFRVAVDAGVDERDALSLVESAVEGEFEPEDAARILSLAAQVSLDHLPVDLFVSKVREGVAKGVDADRIVKAAERQALLVKRASNLLKGLALEGVSSRDRDELLPDVAEAMASGLDEGRIQEIIAEAVAAGDDVGEIRRKLFP